MSLPDSPGNPLGEPPGDTPGGNPRGTPPRESPRDPLGGSPQTLQGGKSHKDLLNSCSDSGVANSGVIKWGMAPVSKTKQTPR